jgi:anthranilate/para-aminobenzoate synthase component I
VRIAASPVPFIQPFDAYMSLRHTYGNDGVYLLESLSGPPRDARSATVGFRPLMTVQVRRSKVTFSGESGLLAQVLPGIEGLGAVGPAPNELVLESSTSLWKLLRFLQSRFAVDHPDPGRSYAFGFFGYFGYDTARFIEDLPYLIEDPGEIPDICLVLFQAVVAFDLVSGTAQIICANSDIWAALEPGTVARLLAGNEPEPEPGIPSVPTPLDVRDSITKEEYFERAERALHHIRVGDIYQVQLGHELAIRSAADPLDVYRRLRHRNPAPYMYLARLGSVMVVGASPEVFVKVEGGTITMRPLAGTIRRGASREEDEAAAAKLRSDEKEVAEHVMLVDLCRNDIGRVCQPRALEVSELLVTEAYSHVFHLVSNVIGKSRSDADAYDVIAATFPAGTMTGAPKVRAMEIIEDLETARRGIYAGALGLIDFSGYVDLALCIRTTLWDGERYFVRASAGIVADSRPEHEWRETIAKMGATYWAIAGRELSPS